MRLQDKIITLRKKNGLSQEILADKLGVSRQAISRWELGTVVPDSKNILEISRIFDVTTDYLLNDDYEADNDLPKVKVIKKENNILHRNLTLIAIISQAAFLNVAMQPFQISDGKIIDIVELIIKFVPLLASSIWMSHNLKYERNVKQFRKNTRFELVYCAVQLSVMLFGYYSRMYFVGSIIIIAVTLFYIFVINPKYMNRQLTRSNKKK